MTEPDLIRENIRLSRIAAQLAIEVARLARKVVNK
jgi:hypothetical protein